jgi:IPT/TIG domain
VQRIASLVGLSLLFWLVGCGGSNNNGNNGSSGTPGGGSSNAVAPRLTSLAPSAAFVGTGSIQLVIYGSNFDSPQIQWNGSVINGQCVDSTLSSIACSQAVALLSTVPADDFSSVGTAKITVANSEATSSPLLFDIVGPPNSGTRVRAIANFTTPNDLVWDAAHGKLYASIASTDTAAPNVIASIDPIAGNVVGQTPASSNPHPLSISSDSSYLWVGLDGSNSVQRFLLPAMTQDISFNVPGNYQQAVALQAAPINSHTVALVAGNVGASPAGEGVYVFDDAVQRPVSVPGFVFGGPTIDWIQWGADDSVIYGNQYTTIDEGGIATLPVTASGVSLGSYSGGLGLTPILTQFDRDNGLLYSFGNAYDPVKLTLAGSFNLPFTGNDEEACTADSSLNRYYCVFAVSVDSTNVSDYQLEVFNLSTYALIQTIDFGFTAGTPLSSINGGPIKLVRWGNAGLAVATQTVPYLGNGGIFLIDGPAVNPNVVPDVSTGTLSTVYPSMAAMTPQAASSSSGTITVTITGTGFSPSSNACWSCSFIQLRLLPTTYVSPTQLTVTMPVSALPTNTPAEISVFDSSLNLFSTNALTFTVLPSSSGTTSGTTQIMPLNLCGLGMAWDSASQLLYVGAADYDGQYPNSIVAINPSTGAVVKTAQVGSDPMYLSDGANGQYLYVAYASTTNMTQLALPSLTPTATAVLINSAGTVGYPGDLKAAPANPHTTAVTLLKPGFQPEALGSVVVFDDDIARPESTPGLPSIQTVPESYDTLAWSSTDSLLTASGAVWDDEDSGPLVDLSVDSSGPSYLSNGAANFNQNAGNLHSDFGTSLIYSDNGNVADPVAGTLVGTYAASGLVAPDSSLNRTFILSQTAAQANTNSYTIVSFNQKTFAYISSITLNNLSGSPVEMVRWGTSGLAILTSGGDEDVYANGLGMLYLVQDSSFVSATAPAQTTAQERGQHYWTKMSKRELFNNVKKQTRANH